MFLVKAFHSGTVPGKKLRVFKTVSDGGVLDELKVVISPCNRVRGGQVIRRGDSTEIINNFKHLS